MNNVEPEAADSEQLFKQAKENQLIDSKDADYALEFITKYNTKNSNSRGSVLKYYFVLKAFLIEMNSKGISLEKMTEDDAYAVFNFVKNNSWSEDTKFNYWKAFVRFYKWTAKKHGKSWDDAVKDLIYQGDESERLKYKINKNLVKKKTTFTPEEVIQLINSEPNLCYKVLYGVLFDGGMRPGEAFSVRLSGVKKNSAEMFTLQMEKSKTRIRPVVLERGTSLAITYLDKYISTHPRKSDPLAPLFCNTLGTQLTGFAANKNLKKLVARITKAETNPEKKMLWAVKDKVSLHCFRHSRATDLANRGLNESLMANLVGWVPGSRMPSVYIRSAQLDAQAALRKVYGIEKVQEKRIVSSVCRNCHTQNPVGNEVCDFCNLPLDEEKIAKIKQAETVNSLVEQLMSEKIKEMEERITKVVTKVKKVQHE